MSLWLYYSTSRGSLRVLRSPCRGPWGQQCLRTLNKGIGQSGSFGASWGGMQGHPPSQPGWPGCGSQMALAIRTLGKVTLQRVVLQGSRWLCLARASRQLPAHHLPAGSGESAVA